MKAKKKKFPIQGYGIAFISLLLIIGVLAIRTTAGRKGKAVRRQSLRISFSPAICFRQILHLHCTILIR